MLCYGLQIELVASLSRLFFLRRLDSRDAGHYLQRVHILVSPIFDWILDYASNRMEIHMKYIY